MIGAGGAARAIAIALAESRLDALTIVNRSLSKADDLANLIRKHFSDQNVHSASIDEIDTIKMSCDLLINATSLGLNDDDPMPVDLEGVAKSTIIADIIMVPEITNWLHACSKQGLTIHLGGICWIIKRPNCPFYWGVVVNLVNGWISHERFNSVGRKTSGKAKKTLGNGASHFTDW